MDLFFSCFGFSHLASVTYMMMNNEQLQSFQGCFNFLSARKIKFFNHYQICTNNLILFSTNFDTYLMFHSEIRTIGLWDFFSVILKKWAENYKNKKQNLFQKFLHYIGACLHQWIYEFNNTMILNFLSHKTIIYHVIFFTNFEVEIFANTS